MYILKNKIAIVTGASRSTGIGTAICRALASAGADIFFTHWQAFDDTEGNGGELGWPEQLAQELQRLGVRVSHIEADYANSDMPKLMMEQVEKTLGVPTILIHNAAYCTPSNYRTIDLRSLDQHYIVNNQGPIMLSMEFARRFEQHYPTGTPGRIMFMVSKGDDPDNLAYIATKGTLLGLIEPLSVGLAPLHITVNGIDPGPTDSGWMDDNIKGFLQPMFPMGRIGVPEDAARAIRFLASDESQWITGQVIKSEGGFRGK